MATNAAKKWESRSKYCFTGIILCVAIYIRFVWLDDDNAQSHITSEIKIFSASAILALSVLGMLSWDISRMDPAESHSITSLLALYLAIKIGSKLGKRALKNFEKGAVDIKTQQENYLLKLLKTHSESVYGKEFKFSEINTVKDFQNRHPVCTYEHYRPYVNRICEGDKNVLTTSTIMFLARTSGTTGKCKLVPFTTEHQKSMLSLYPAFGYVYSPELKGAKRNLQKIFIMNFRPKVEMTKSGLRAGPMGHFLSPHYPFLNYPSMVSDITDEVAAYYVHGVFLLREPHIGTMGFIFSYQTYTFLKYLEFNWESLCDDIEHGTLKEDLEIHPELYRAIKKLLKPDKARADELRSEMSNGVAGLAKRIWPGLQYWRANGTGSMEVYTKLLLEGFMNGVLHLSAGYGGSEGFYGVNTTSVQNDPGFSLAYQNGFFEFIPEDCIGEKQLEDKTLLAHEVKKGCNYELVVTNALGLYRYRLGDVVKITSFVNQCPVLEFQYRIGQILNLRSEKTTETVFYNSLVKAAAELKVSIVDYTTCEDVYLYGIQALKEYTRKYVLLIELDRKITESEETEKFDQCLCEMYEPYQLARRKEKLFAPMQVYQLKAGTFERLRNIMTADNPNNMQFKMSRTLRNKDNLNFLMENQI